MKNLEEVKFLKISLKFAILTVAFMLLLCTFGCDQTTLSYGTIERDEELVGGLMSFEYDIENQTAYVGGERQIVQYSCENLDKGFEQGGPHVGLKISAPQASLDLETAVLEFKGKTLTASQFLQSVNGKNQPFFYLYPYMTEENPKTSFAITWQEGAEKQTYHIEIMPGTRYLSSQGVLVDYYQ